MRVSPENMIRWAFVWLILPVGLFAPAAAMEHPDQAVGFAAGGLQNLAIDNVSTYNGGLTVSVPVGPLFQLIYNSHPWSSATRDIIYTEVFPNGRNTAGMGWRLSLGKLYAPFSWFGNETPYWVYVGPDGSSHNFYHDLHEGEDDGDPDVMYSRDGSYLRLIHDWNGSSSWKAIEFPDGTRQTFAMVPGWTTNFTLRKIEDRFGNYTEVAYSYPDGGWTGSQVWTITDNHGRTHYAYFSPVQNIVHRVTSVDYETVGGQRAVYQFVYGTVKRFRPYDTYPFNNDNINLPFLTKVIFPDNSEMKMTDATGWPNYLGSHLGWPTAVLRGIELPTGGRLEWDFTEWAFAGNNSNDWSHGAGVTERRMIRSDGTTESIVTYDQGFIPASGWPKVAYQNDVVYPGGHCTRHFFHHDKTLSTVDWGGWDHGLSFRKDVTDGERFLSSEVWSSSSGTTCSGTKLRETWVRYEHDQLPNSTHPSVADRWFASNIRMVNQRTVYKDDGDRYVDTLYEDFDGLGHYRKATTSGDLKSQTTLDSRTTTTNFNPGRGTYEIDQSTNQPTGNHTYTAFSTTDEWLLALYDYTEVSEPGAYQLKDLREEFDFDPATGFLRANRTLTWPPARSANDILRVFTATAEGQVASTALYGGDTQALSTAPGWTPPTTWSYKVENTYQYGVLKTSRAVKPDGTYMPFYSTDLDLDPSTGATLVSRDPSGLATTFTYDLLGRVTDVTPDEGAITRNTYANAGGGLPAKLTTLQYESDGTTPMTYRETWFDDFGRTWRERRMVPDHGWVDRETLYTVSGAVDSVSAWGDLTKVTRYLNHDAFGRPTLVRPPEGAAHDVLMAYTGDRYVRTQTSIATSPGQESVVSRDAYSDSFGRTWLVNDVGLVGGLDQHTSYIYNVTNKLRRIYAKAADTQVVQQRYFTYDGRGFLMRERHPEKGTTGSDGWVYYYDFDALGKPGRVLDGPNDVGYGYDALGRTLRVEDRNQGNRPLKLFGYDGANGRGEGRLWWERRYNYVTVPWEGVESTRMIQDTYSYTGLGGRVSFKTTNFVNENLLARSSYAYDDRGQVSGVTYPSCIAGYLCSQVPPPARTVNYDYEFGQLRQVPGWTNTVTYHPSGAWDQMPRVNAVTDGRDRDTASPDRLNRFYATGPSSWDSGLMQYDGTGNLKAIGSENYTYDNASRLTSGTAGGESQDYTYDAFGNITQIDHTAGGSTTTRTIAVVPSTNRLSVASYDTAGNMTSWVGKTYTWDPLGSLSQFSGDTWTYLYDAQDRRVAILEDGDGTVAGKRETYLVRGLNGRVHRELKIVGASTPGNTTWSKDNVFFKGVLFASVRFDGTTRHYHRDHQQNLRLITDASGAVVGNHLYLPYGEEVTDSSQNDEVMKYTLHQRDENHAGTDDDLDYMLARYYSPHLGRFLSLDPDRGMPGRLQSLNRYAYARQNPLRYVDPDGRLVAQFRGGVIPSASFSTGLDELADECYGGDSNSIALFGGTQTFNYTQGGLGGVGESTIRGNMARDPDQPLIIIGHSRGGVAAIGLANRLAADGIVPDLLVLIDPEAPFQSGPYQVDERIPTILYYSEDSPLGAHAGDVVGSSVSKYLYPGSHTDIDGDPAVQAAICNNSKRAAVRRRLQNPGADGQRRDPDTPSDGSSAADDPFGWAMPTQIITCSSYFLNGERYEQCVVQAY